MSETKYTPLVTRDKFFKLSKRKQRVLIAQDVVMRLKLNMLSPITGSFIHIKEGIGRYIDKSLATQATVNTHQCEVCAKGALACAWLGNLNLLNADDFNLDTTAQSKGTQEMVGTFGHKLLNRIEGLYECWTAHTCRGQHSSWGGDAPDRNYDDNSFQLESYNKYMQRLCKLGDGERLTTIMNNIVKNKGRLLIPGLNKKKGYYIGT